MNAPALEEEESSQPHFISQDVGDSNDDALHQEIEAEPVPEEVVVEIQMMEEEKVGELERIEESLADFRPEIPHGEQHVLEESRAAGWQDDDIDLLLDEGNEERGDQLLPPVNEQSTKEAGDAPGGTSGWDDDEIIDI